MASFNIADIAVFATIGNRVSGIIRYSIYRALFGFKRSYSFIAVLRRHFNQSC